LLDFYDSLGITIVGVFEASRPKAKRVAYLFELGLLFSFQRPTRKHPAAEVGVSTHCAL